MRTFCQFEVDFYVLNQAIHLNRGFGVRLFLAPTLIGDDYTDS